MFCIFNCDKQKPCAIHKSYRECFFGSLTVSGFLVGLNHDFVSVSDVFRSFDSRTMSDTVDSSASRDGQGGGVNRLVSRHEVEENIHVIFEHALQ